MSDHTAAAATARRSNRTATVPQENATMPQDTAPAAAATQTVTIEIAGLQVTLPVKFRAGHMLTENQAKILDAAYQRQFTNNQNANAKARAERFAKDGKTEDAPQTATDIAALYIDYEPTVGGGVRGNTREALRHAMAWRFWTTLVAEHNDSIAKGGDPVIAKAGAKVVTLATKPRKAKDQTEEAHKAAVEAFENDRTMFCTRLLEHKEYGPKIAALVEAEIAAKKAESGAVKTDSAEVIVSDESIL